MKKYILLLLTSFSLTFITSCEKDDDDNDNYESYEEYTSLEASNLTQQVIDSINAYITNNHSNAFIVEVEIENQEIEVELNDRTELVFDLDGVFVRYDEEYTSLEASNLTQEVIDSINAYITNNHSDANIVEVEIENQEIEVELNDRTELVFDLDGVFVRYDD